MEYSISIRTLGNVNDNYRKLMHSIQRQTIQPNDVNIILPEGFEKPERILGYEKYYFAKKGMLSQRIKGVEAASTDYVLLLDDDIEFEEKFVEKLSNTLYETDADILFPQYRLKFPQGIRKITEAVLARAIPMQNNNNYYVRIIGSSGYVYNTNKSDVQKVLKSESGLGMCLFIKKKAIDNIDYEEELWVDVNSYSYLDDAVFVYKAFLNSLSIYAVPNLQIEHLGEERTTSKARRIKAAYSEPHNTIMFFYRLVLKNKKNKIISYLIFCYWLITNSLFSFLRSIMHRMPIFYYFWKGIIHGYCRSKRMNNS